MGLAFLGGSDHFHLYLALGHRGGRDRRQVLTDKEPTKSEGVRVLGGSEPPASRSCS